MQQTLKFSLQCRQCDLCQSPKHLKFDKHHTPERATVDIGIGMMNIMKLVVLEARYFFFPEQAAPGPSIIVSESSVGCKELLCVAHFVVVFFCCVA